MGTAGELSLQRAKLPPGLTGSFAILFCAIVVGGYWFYHSQERMVREECSSQLMAISHLKVDQIHRWRATRASDAHLIMGSPFFLEAVAQWLEERHSGLEENLRKRLRLVAEHGPYMDILIVDAHGSVLFSLHNPGSPLDAEPRDKLAQAIHDGKPTITDLYLLTDGKVPCLDVIAPLFLERRASGKLMGALILRVDASRTLYPLIEFWPLPSQSGETLLVKRVGEDVLFLNELRHQRGTALNLKISLNQRELPAVMAVQGKEGVVQGKDYRGVEVLSALSSIPESPWFMVAKVDTQEAFSAWYSRSKLILSVAFLLLALTFGEIGFIWQRRQSQQYKTLYQSENERLQLIKRCEYLLKYANDIIVLVDENGRILEANDRAVESYGYTRDQFLALNLPDIIAREERLAYEARLPELMEHGSLRYETLHQRQDGSVFPVEISSRLMQMGGRQHVQHIVRDVTERKKAESRQSQLTEELRDFTYVVSHDLRAPVTNIKGFLNELELAFGVLCPVVENVLVSLPQNERHKVAAAVQEDVPEALQFIGSSLTAMNSLIEQILQLSRVGRVDLVFAPIDMNDLMARVLATFAYELQEKGIVVHIDPLPEVIADRTAMEQIMSNLLGNAIKYRDRDRPLTIAVTGHRLAHETSFVVLDNGRGIEQDDLSRIFRPFQRVGTQEVPGEGMGLAHVRTLVRRHRGTIWCESNGGGGATFTFTISNRPEEAEES